MKNYIQDGSALTLTAPAGGVVSGTAYKVGSVVVVAKDAAAAGSKFVGERCGVFSLPVGTDTPAEGGKAYHKSDNTITTNATGNTLVGVFVAAKDSDNNAEVLLTGQIA